MSRTLREAAQQALDELDHGLQFGTVTRARSILRAALAAEDEAQPYAYAVYFPDQPTEELVHDLDDLCDDLTNREHEIRPLYAAPQSAIPEGWKLVGYYHIHPGDDCSEDDFYSADAVNGDCENCHPAYIQLPIPQPAEREQAPLTQPEGQCPYCLTYNGHQDGCEQTAIPAGIKLAMQKIESAMCAHPNAVPTLMGEAYEALSSAMLAADRAVRDKS